MLRRLVRDISAGFTSSRVDDDVSSSYSDRPTVLVVDDERSILTWLKRSLHEFGFDVVEAMESRAALAILLESNVDALILDVRLAGHSGLEVLEYVRSRPELARLPVIVLTGLAHLTEQEEETIRRHHAYVFYKPEGVEVIVGRLNELLARGQA
jgi:response regulator RpfG family c-di-GMP phosphodiesterase